MYNFIFSAFFWLLSLLISSIIWFAAVPLREKLAFGLVFSIIFQEIFRFLIYLLLSKADAYLRKLTENESTRIFANRHILSYGKFVIEFRKMVLHMSSLKNDNFEAKFKEKVHKVSKILQKETNYKLLGVC